MKKISNLKTNISSHIIRSNGVLPIVASQIFNQTLSNTSVTKNFNLYIDVSNFSSMDNKTGIQRVVREVIFELLQDIRFKNKIKFIVATKKIGYRLVDYHLEGNTIVFARDKVTKHTPLINLCKNDVYLGLDFTPNVVPEHFMDFLKWRLFGAKLIWILYDLLPLQHPEWFTTATQETYLPWFKTLLYLANDIMCISKTVQREVKDYAYDLGLTPRVSHIELGYGFHSDITRAPSPAISTTLKHFLASTDFALMVGTLEPRKGHLEIIQSFLKLWQEDLVETPLVLVGKMGWNTEILKDIITSSKYLNTKLFWLENTNDDDLKWLYQHTKGVIVASYGEGYGLPLIEAILNNRHVLARDLAVFKEVATNKNNVTFFSSNSKDASESIKDWIDINWCEKIIPNEMGAGESDWKNSVECIYQAIF